MTKEDYLVSLKEMIAKSYPNLRAEQNILRQIDSLSLVDFIIKLEAEFKIHIQPNEMNDRNFASLDAVAAWLSKKQV